jgi:predicted RNA-binding protein YlxR (DUF448 family)
MTGKWHVPMRMCIGCRKRNKKEEMVRFKQGIDGILFLDVQKKTNGRGFYLCPDVACLKLAQKKVQMEQVHSIGGSKVSFDSRSLGKGLA